MYEREGVFHRTLSTASSKSTFLDPRSRMADMFLALRSFAVVSILVLATIAYARPLEVQDGPVAAIKAAEAAPALQAYGDSARKAGRRPDFAAEAVSAKLHAIFDVQRFLALPEPSARDLPWLLDWHDAASRGFKQLVLVGLTPGQQPDHEKLARNLRDYEDQIAPAISFLLHMYARELPAAAMFVDELPKEQLTPIQIAGFRGLRSGAVEFIKSAFCTAHAMQPINSRIVMTAARETQSIWAGEMDSDDRTATMAQLKLITDSQTDEKIVHLAVALMTSFAGKK